MEKEHSEERSSIWLMRISDTDVNFYGLEPRSPLSQPPLLHFWFSCCCSLKSATSIDPGLCAIRYQGKSTSYVYSVSLLEMSSTVGKVPVPTVSSANTAFVVKSNEKKEEFRREHEALHTISRYLLHYKESLLLASDQQIEYKIIEVSSMVWRIHGVLWHSGVLVSAA